MEITKINGISGEITVPGDKSISHRGVMFGAISQGITELTGFLDGADCRSTISCFRKMGIEIKQDNDHVIIYGKGLHGLSSPTDILDVGNSGTTTRLMSGILAGSNFTSTVNGDASIQTRPMKRIITPLSMMGADIKSLRGNDCAPLQINGGHLHPIHYDSPVASAQVKSAVLLAGLYCDGVTSVTEPVLSRNHTELMLSGFGAEVTSQGTTASVVGLPQLQGQKIFVPGDISSAAYFIAAALIAPNAELTIRNVNCNPTRDGILKVAEAMGGNIKYENKRIVSGEEVCDLVVKSSSLQGTTVGGDIIPTLIDEIPMIAVMAAYANGTTIIKDAAELKVKESNRIDSVVMNLQAMGVDVTATDDGMVIHGGQPLHGAHIITKSDHRIAMAFAIAGLIATGITTFDDPNCVVISYPSFYETLSNICH
ncbi:MAG: 3-phosphoshikimate 1-carboxyvinyltransferase [Lachnospiraceae bacterium]|nr:3-phosphoshikimate 1-carboxyvinyltransferase [Lachnospiraceae bacterium]